MPAERVSGAYEPVGDPMGKLEPLVLPGTAGLSAVFEVLQLNSAAASEITTESLPSPERPKLKLVRTAVISGPSYAGKDALVDILRARHGWPVFDGSEVKFERRGTNSITSIQRKRRDHIGFDRYQAKRFADLKPGDEMWLHQTRLGGIILAAERDRRSEKLVAQSWQMQTEDNPEPLGPIPARSILLWATKEVRENRAVNHANTLADKEGKPRPTRAQVIADLERKQKSEVDSWAPHYRTINIRPNPFSRHLRRKMGAPVYDRFINTSELTIEQVADEVEKVLKSLGAVEVIDPSNNPAEGNLAELPVVTGEPMTYGSTQDAQTTIITDFSNPITP